MTDVSNMSPPPIRMRVDPDIIARLISDLPQDNLGTLVSGLLGEIESQIQFLKRAPSAAVLRVHAHHLSDLAATLGAVDLAAAAADFERAVTQGRRPDIEPLMGLALESRQLIERAVRLQTQVGRA